MTQRDVCPVCGEPGTRPLIERENLITMQNYVYRDRESAINSPVGDFVLRVCERCGFAHNALFDSEVMCYDANYDNLVPSKLFLKYYEQVAQFLYERYDLENQFVVEIGCGKGTFLKTLCGLYPSVRGLGVDPSFEPSDSDKQFGNIEFIQDRFKQKYLTRSPKLVICRHVLEHIADPVAFLAAIRETLEKCPDTPVFIEVPNFDWIIENGAFWDFCYEHCNYFTPEGLKNTVKVAGFDPRGGDTSFGRQYQWITCVPSLPTEPERPDDLTKSLAEYAATEKTSMTEASERLRDAKANGSVVVIWGMATKGVVFCNLIDPFRDVIDYCIDINPNKQGAFVPRMGRQISAPEILREIDSSANAIIIVMNPNYLSEIKETCAAFSRNVSFVDADGNRL